MKYLSSIQISPNLSLSLSLSSLGVLLPLFFGFVCFSFPAVNLLKKPGRLFRGFLYNLDAGECVAMLSFNMDALSL